MPASSLKADCIRAAVLAAGFTLLTCVWTWPLTPFIGDGMIDKWDGLLHTLILEWDVQQFLGEAAAPFFNLPIFYPHENALAFSEHLIGSALFALPVRAAGQEPLLAHNLIGVLSFPLSALAMYAFAFEVTRSRWGALAAALVYGFCPWRMGQLGHMAQLLTYQWIPLALLFLRRTLRQGRLRDTAAVTLFVLLQALSSYYTAAFLMVGLACVTVYEILRRPFSPTGEASLARSVAVLGAAAVFAGAVMWPVSHPYFEVRESLGLSRSFDDVVNTSASLYDYLTPPVWSAVYQDLRIAFQNPTAKWGAEHWLFPGFLVLGVGIFSATAFPWFTFSAVQDRRWSVIPPWTVFLLIAVVAVLLSLGPRLHMGWERTDIPLPYSLLYHHVPGFEGLRAPTRFAALAMLGLAGLVAAVLKHAGQRTRRPAIAGVLVLGVITVEYLPRPPSFFPMPSLHAMPAAYRWMENHAAAGAPIAALPADPGLAPLDIEYEYLYYLTRHGRPLVNGRSGYTPPATMYALQILDGFPDARSVKLLSQLGVKHVVVHEKALSSDRAQRIRTGASQRSLVTEMYRDTHDAIYALPGAEAGSRSGHKATFTALTVPPALRPRTPVSLIMTISNQTLDFLFRPRQEVFTVTLRSPDGVEYRETARAHVLAAPNAATRVWLAGPRIDVPGAGDWEVTVTCDGLSARATWTRRLTFTDDADAYWSAFSGYRAEFVEVTAPETVRMGTEFTITAQVRNTGTLAWDGLPDADAAWMPAQAYAGIVGLGLQEWRDGAGQSLPAAEQPPTARARLDRPVSYGKSARYNLTAQAPLKPGRYRAKLDMVAEHMVWFEKAGGTPYYVDVVVTP